MDQSSLISELALFEVGVVRSILLCLPALDMAADS